MTLQKGIKHLYWQKIYDTYRKITPENIEQAVNEDQANLRNTLKGLLAEIKIARTDIRELKSKQLGDSHKLERKD